VRDPVRLDRPLHEFVAQQEHDHHGSIDGGHRREHAVRDVDAVNDLRPQRHRDVAVFDPRPRRHDGSLENRRPHGEVAAKVAVVSGL